MSRKEIQLYVGKGLTRARQLARVYELKEQLGPHPHLRYVEACIHAEKRRRHEAFLKKIKDRRDAKSWWKNGGQRATYFKNHGRFGGQHSWLLNLIFEETGVTPFNPDDDECWDEEDPDECSTGLSSCAVRVKPVKACKHCGLRSCAEFEFGCAAHHAHLEKKRELLKSVVRAVRSPILLKKLRALIRELQERRAAVVLRRAWIRSESQASVDLPIERPPVYQEVLEVVQHQMHSPDEHGDGTVNVVQKSNVVVTEQHAADVAAEVPTPSAVSLVSGDIINKFPTLSGRPYIMKTQIWSTTDVVHTVLWSARLPRDFVIKAKDSPNIAPFKVHRYFRGDVVVRVQINANKFMSGQLQLSWYYQNDLDRNFAKLRNNVYSGSQTLHTLINAGTSNEAILRIPYRYYKPMLEVPQREDKEVSLNMGNLYLRVLNVLQACSASSNHCSLNVFVHLENAEFTGTVAAQNNVVQHQMDPMAGALLAGALTKFIDNNRDNPTTSAHPTYFSPQTAQSWSIGTNTSEDLYSLRLSHAMQPTTPDFAIDTFTISDVCQRFGLIAQGNWSQTKVSGSKLFSAPASPLMRPQDYKSIVLEQENCYFLPPVSVLANLYQYWRGSLELRIDFVATQMHTGRIIIGYVPGDYKEELTLEDLYSSPYAEFDLKESQQLTFRIPYVSDKKYWPRVVDLESDKKNLYAPGFVYAFVLNSLVVMDSIPIDIQYNIYLRGCEDFELVVPAQPTIGLSFNVKSVQPSDTTFYRKGGYNDGVYIGTYTNLLINNQSYSQGQLFAIARWGPAYGHVVEYDYPKDKAIDWNKGYAYYCESSVAWKLRKSGEKEQSTKFWFPWMDDARMYMLPLQAEDKAKLLIEKLIEAKGRYEAIFTNLPDQPATRPDYYFYVYPDDDADPYYDAENLVSFTIKEVKQFAVHQTGDNRMSTDANVLSPASSVPSTSFGATHFGENFSELKDLCRRYQPYGTAAFTVANYKKFSPGDVLFTFPILPHGLDLPIDTKDNTPVFINKCRDGPIPILLSAYRYYKGSVRFRLVLPDIAGTFFIQHVPSIPLDHEKILLCKPKQVENSSQMLNHGYALTVQSQRINNIISFEVPFYLQYDSLLLQRGVLQSKDELKDYHTALCLGEIRVGLLQRGEVRPKDDGPVLFQIAYSLGDDAQPSVFQGFPPMLLVQDISAKFKRTPAQHQMFKGVRKLAKSGTKISNIVTTIDGMDLNKTKELTDDTLIAMGKTVERAEQSFQHLEKFCGGSLETFNSFMEDLRGSGAPSLLIGAFGQIAQVINNPKPSVMAIALGHFLLSMGFVAVTSVDSISSLVTRIFTQLQPKQTNGETAQAQHQTLNSEDGVALASVLFAGISTALNVKYQANSKFTKGLGKDLLDGVTSGCKDGSFFYRFLMNVLSVILKIFAWIKKKAFPTSFGLESLIDSEQIVKKWVEEAILLTDVNMESFFDVVPVLAERVDACYIVGSLIMARVACASKAVNVAAIKDLHTKICTLRTTLADKGKCSGIRREPFIIYILGKPGIGKSQMALRNIVALLDAAQITYDTSPVYTHQAGAKYWENVNQEPAMLIDDAFVLRSGETADLEMTTMMALKSTALFTPPIAECDRKKKRYAPELVYVHTNNAFPPLTNMQTAEALYRRRDMLWEADLLEGYELKTWKDHFSTAQMNVCEHLRFRYHRCPRDKDLVEPWSDWMTFQEFFTLTADTFRDFRARMIETHAANVDIMHAAMQQVSAYPELTKQPLLEILKLYSEKALFPDTAMYVPKAIEIVQRSEQVAVHQIKPITSFKSGKTEMDVIIAALNEVTKPQSLHLLKKFADHEFLQNVFEVICSRDTYTELQDSIPDGVVQDVATIVYNDPLMKQVISKLYRLNNPLNLPLTDNDIATRLLELSSWYNFPLEIKSMEIGASTKAEEVPADAKPKAPRMAGKQIFKTPPLEVSLDSPLPCDTTKPPPPIEVNVVVEKLNSEQEARVEALLADLGKDIKIAGVPKFYTREELNALHAIETTDVCDNHIIYLSNTLDVKNMEAGRKLLFGEQYPTLSLSERHTLYKAALKKYGCRHFWAFTRSWVSVATICCMKEASEPHLCRMSEADRLPFKCGPECAAHAAIPISGEWVDECKNCIRYYPKMLKVARQLYVAAHPGTLATKACGQPQAVPPFLFDNFISDTVVRVWKTVKDTLKKIKDYLSEITDKVFGKFKSLWNFLKAHKGKIFAFLGICSALGGSYALHRSARSATGDGSVMGTVAYGADVTTAAVGSIVTTAKDSTVTIAEKVKSMFGGQRQSPYQLDADPDTLQETVSVGEVLASHEIIASGDPKASAKAARLVFKAKTLANAQAVTGTAQHQISHSDVVAKRILDNTVHLIGVNLQEDGRADESSAIVARALALGDRYVLTVKHAWEVWLYNKLDVVQCMVKDRFVNIKISDIRMSVLNDSSLCVLRFPSNFPQFRKIVSFFASELDHIYRCPSFGTIITNGTVCMISSCTISTRHSPLAIDGLSGAERVEIAGLYQYDTQSPGMCGSLLVADSLNSPIIGMHIAGCPSSRRGFAEPLFRETFMPLFEGLIKDVAFPEFEPAETAKIDLQTTIFPVGSIGKKMAHHSPSETAIHNSFIHGYVKPKSAPAPLSEKDPRLPPGNSPLVKGCEKHGILTQNFSPAVVARATERLKTHLFAKCRPLRNVSPLQLTDQQAVCGDPQLEFCDPLKWNSSEGYPYFKFRPAGVTDKKWLFKLKEDNSGLTLLGYHPMLDSILNYKRNERANGVQQPTIFVDCLKDARIPISKVSTPGKTRIFSMSPVDYTIEFRKYFYDFISTFQSLRLDNFNAIGINVFSREWDVLAHSLLRHPNICTGDYSNFGPGLNLEVARSCLNIVLAWYDHFDDQQSNEDRMTRACLLSELIGSLHLSHDLVYQVVAGIPSGSPITVVLNSLVNIMYLFIAWDLLSETWPIEFRAFSNFENNIVLYTYGDDFIFSVSDLYRDKFNSKILSELFLKYDIKLTDAFKGTEVTPYASIRESSFLKGVFVNFDGRYWYGLDKDQVYDMVNFINTKHNIIENTKVNADMSLIHAHGHGKSFFDKVKSRITAAFAKEGVVFQGRTFKEITDLKNRDSEDRESRDLLKKLLPLF